MFVVRYAHFHQLLERQALQDASSDLVAIFREDLAPKSWWAVLLCDSVQLLQYGMCNIVLCSASNTFPPDILLFTSSEASALLHKLEEVFVRTSQGAGDDYLSILTRTIKGREKEAFDRLNVVRLAFARYFARCTALNLGGN